MLVTRARGAEAKGGIVAITLVAGFAGTLSFPVANALAGGLGWRAAVQVIGLFVALIVAPLLWWAAARLERERRAHPHHAAEAPETQPRFLRRPAFWALGLAMALMATVHSATLQHLLPILDEHRLAPATAVFVASLIGPMQVAGRLAMIWAGRFLSHHGLTLTCFAMIGTAEIVLVASGRAPVLLWLFVPLFGGAVGVVSILRPLLAREILGPRNFGAKSGALAFLFLAGGASAPWLGALIWGWGGYDAMLALLTCAAALGAGLYAIARRFGADARSHVVTGNLDQVPVRVADIDRQDRPLCPGARDWPLLDENPRKVEFLDDRFHGKRRDQAQVGRPRHRAGCLGFELAPRLVQVELLAAKA